MAPDGLDALWQYACAAAEDGWTPLGGTPDMSLSVRDVAETTLLRVSYNLTDGTVLQNFLNFCANPEQQDVGYAKIIEVHDLAPGDLIAKARFELGMLSKCQALMGPSNGDKSNTITSRMSKRMAFPRSDQHTFLWADCDADSWEVLDQSKHSQLMSTGVTVFGPEPCDCIDVTVMPPKMDGWTLAQTVHHVFTPTWKAFVDMPVKLQKSRYVVVAVKGCKPAGPLIKALSGDWVRYVEDMSIFSLPNYLRLLLEVLDMAHIKVWSFADGLQVVPYQAVILQKHWDEFWEAMGPAWGEMRTAYRAAHGGTSAPRLVIAKHPSFAQPLSQLEPLGIAIA